MGQSFALALLVSVAACSRGGQQGGSGSGGRPTAAEAGTFVERAEQDLATSSEQVNRMQWVAANFITDDTEALSAEAQKNFSIMVRRLAAEARRFDGIEVPAPVRRKLNRLKVALDAPPPDDLAKAAELAKLTTGMEADYGKGTYCRAPQPGSAAAKRGEREECLQINDMVQILAQSHNPEELLDVWQGWHRIGAPLRQRYTRYVELANTGARELGMADVGALWRSRYDMPPDSFTQEIERLWSEVRPLYLALHAYVRTRLGERYGTKLVPPDGPIPAHLLGNMWAQDWENIYPLVASREGGDPGYDLTERLKAKKVDQRGMVRYSEGFFTSLGLPELPKTFWDRSLIVKPRDREVVCHASAWDLDNQEDVRIKMCADVTGDDFVTMHHELGHNYYQLAYKGQPFLFKDGANDGFHEAIGDAIALAITPEYLQKVGLLDRVPTTAADTALLLRQALGKVAFLPFGLLVDQWRWQVFSGKITPANYNSAWWALRERYQGVSAPLPRSESDFDPGAKYHIPANVPYTRYFLASVLQFQFYRALCQAAGYTGPLHRCSFFGSKAAGQKLEAMLAAGASRPWPEVLEAITGKRQLDAGAMLEYFAPLSGWLERQNRGKPIGWDKTAAPSQ